MWTPWVVSGCFESREAAQQSYSVFQIIPAISIIRAICNCRVFLGDTLSQPETEKCDWGSGAQWNGLRCFHCHMPCVHTRKFWALGWYYIQGQRSGKLFLKPVSNRSRQSPSQKQYCWCHLHNWYWSYAQNRCRAGKLHYSAYIARRLDIVCHGIQANHRAFVSIGLHKQKANSVSASNFSWQWQWPATMVMYTFR